MATKAAPKAAAADAPAEKPKKSRLLIIIIALVILLAGAGGGAWYFLGQKAEDKPGHAEKHDDAEAKPPVFLPMESFTVNLQPGDSGTEQFLQISLTLQVDDEKQVEILKQYMPHVRSQLLLLLSGKKAADILTPDGKNKLSQEIINMFKQPFVPGGPKVNVSSVLFTSFVVQ
jgi:flagellar FliL protein